MDEIVARRIVDYLTDSEDGMVALLEQLVLAESPSNVAEAQARPLALIAQMLQSLEYEVEIHRGRHTGGHLLAWPRRMTGDSGQQLLLGHCDTVWPIGTLETMPFVVQGNQIGGPGVFDMKGGLVQMLFALKALYALGLEPSLAPTVFVNTDEEIGSPESGARILELAERVRRVFVLEPALGRCGKLKTARKGVGHFRVRVDGVSAHAGLDPEKGRSAILEMSYVIQQLQSMNDLESGISVNVGVVQGGLRSNVVAPSCTAEVDVRVTRAADAQLMDQAMLGLQPVAEGVTITVTGGLNRAPMERTPANRALWHRARTAAALLDIDLAEGTAGGGSDGNLTSQLTATLDGLGAVGDGAHATHEFLFRDKLVPRSALLGLLLLAEDDGAKGS